MGYVHISNNEVFDEGLIDENRIFLRGKKYRIISFEIATGDFIVEEIEKDDIDRNIKH